jgi:hypothetical protein
MSGKIRGDEKFVATAGPHLLDDLGSVQRFSIEPAVYLVQPRSARTMPLTVGFCISSIASGAQARAF